MNFLEIMILIVTLAAVPAALVFLGIKMGISIGEGGGSAVFMSFLSIGTLLVGYAVLLFIVMVVVAFSTDPMYTG